MTPDNPSKAIADGPLLDYTRLDRAAVRAYQSKERFGPASEGLIRGFYEAVLVKGDAAVDVGVHYARHLLPMRACVGDEGLVFGIEANVERYAAILKKLSKQNFTNVHLLNIAASDQEGFREFFVNRTHSGRSGLRDNRLAPADIVETTKVYAAPLAAVLPPTLAPKFIKIDIEGAEFPALLGAKRLLSSARPLLVFEGQLTATARKFGFGPARVERYMREIGYSVFDLFGNRVELPAWTGGFGWNFVAGPEEPAARETIRRALTHAWSKTLST